MELDPAEQRRGYIWFFGASAFALGVIFIVVNGDRYLSTSKREVVVHDTLKELRTAQTSLDSLTSDERQTLNDLHEVTSDADEPRTEHY